MTVDSDIGWLNRITVLGNQAVFGAVNAGRPHCEQAAGTLADRIWLERPVAGRVPDAKVVVEFDGV